MVDLGEPERENQVRSVITNDDIRPASGFTCIGFMWDSWRFHAIYVVDMGRMGKFV